MEEENKKSPRILILALILTAVFLLFAAQLFHLQILKGSDFREQADKGSVRTMSVEAARGEIVDRYGRPLAVNRMGYAVVFDKAFLPDDNLNYTIDTLTKLLASAGETWEDNLPLETTAPYGFVQDQDEKVSKMIKALKLNHYATAENCFDAMVEKYGLEGYEPDIQRRIMGVRYEMESIGYSLTVPYTFSTDISDETMMKIKEQNYLIPGVDVNSEPIREYVSGSIAPHIVGSISPIYADEYKAKKEEGYKMNDTIGRSGAEAAFENELRGISGSRIITQDASGAVTDVTVTEEPQPGNTVMLTLDKRLQEETQEILKNKILDLQAKTKKTFADSKVADAGAAVVYKVKTGEILAAATYPSYDINEDYNDIKVRENGPLTNRAFQGIYRPGSTFKPAVALSALTAGAITPTGRITCNRYYRYFQDHTFSCLGSHGSINVTSALRVSCNIFFYESGRRTGIETLDYYCKQLGLGEATGLEQEFKENPGVLDGKEYREQKGIRWEAGDVVQFSIGQANNQFSPLQLVSYCATIANNGTRMKAHLLKSVNSYGDQRIVKETEPEVLNVAEFSASAYEPVQKGMYQVVNENYQSIRNAFADVPVTVAGKTGTAQVGPKRNGKYVDNENVLFMGYGPYEDPEIAVCIIVEHGSSSPEVAAAAAEIFKAYYNYSGDTFTPSQSGELLP